MKKVLAIFISLMVGASPANAKNFSSTGNQGQSITISQNTFKSGSIAIVSGAHFDESVGIYLAFCVMQPPGQNPTPCGGGVNKSGIGNHSFWISSNPPPYGKGLAIAFKPGGRFKEKVIISRFIGKFDCKKIKCAITVKADHLMANDRSHDIFIPVKIS